MQKRADPVFDLKAEMEAAEILLANLRDIVAGDDEAAADIVEGETNLLEAVNAAVDLVQQHEAHADAIGVRIKTLQDRKARLQHKADLTREAIAVAMDVAKRKKLATPLGTVSLKATPQKVELVDESEIPTKYFVRPEPTLSKKAILEDLKAGVEVPGCKLSEAGTTIAIRA